MCCDTSIYCFVLLVPAHFHLRHGGCSASDHACQCHALQTITATLSRQELPLPPFFYTLCTWLLLMLQKENLDTAFELLHEMAGQGLQADNTTYTTLFNLCAEARQGRRAEQLMQVQLSPPWLV